MRYVFHHFIEGSGAGGSYLIYEMNNGKRTGKCMTDRGVLLPAPHHLEKTNMSGIIFPSEQRPKPLVSRTKHTQGCILMHALFCRFPLFFCSSGQIYVSLLLACWMNTY